MWILMNKVTPIAKIVLLDEATPELAAGVTLLPDVSVEDLPILMRSTQSDMPGLIAFLDWIKTRVFPKNRIDSAKLLGRMRLTEYDPLEIAKHTRAALINDDFWVKFNEDDNYYLHTLRGRAAARGVLGDISNVPEQYRIK